MNSIVITVIGGFGFNFKPLACLNKLNLPLNFIDINLFNPAFSLQAMAKHISNQLSNTNNLIIAYSSGGLIALKVALQQPNLIFKLILINSTPKFMQDATWQGIKPVNLTKLIEKLNQLKLNKFMDYFTHLAIYPNKAKHNIDQDWYSQTNKSNLINLLHLIATTDLRQELAWLKIKPLWINSTQDILVPINTTLIKPRQLNHSTHLIINQIQLLAILRDYLCI